MTQEDKKLLLKDLCARFSYEKLIDACIERIDNEIGLADGSCYGFDKLHLVDILNDLVISVYERIV